MHLTHAAGRHRTARSLASLAAVVAVIVILALTSLSTRVRAAVVPSDPSAAAGSTSDARSKAKRIALAAAEKKAVIVVGPVGSSTTEYIGKANKIADAATAKGMQVVKIYHPNATWARVVAEANGADFFVYLGHGNGWPSPYGTFQEDTKNGLGLNPPGGSTNAYDTRYYGANKIREQIQFAPNAIILLNKICYANGNAEPGMAIPTTDVARQRVDNFAAGFLDSGAAVVFALGWQPGENLVDSLFSGTPTTMDGFFQTKFGGNRDGSYAPYFGWIGWKPNLYFDSQRVAGARNHLDPDSREGFLRAVTGDLEMTNDEWLGVVDPDDTVPPVVSDVTADQAANTIPAGENSVPVFTPNGDKLSDTIALRYTISEGSFVTVDVRKEDGSSVRRFTGWAAAGNGSSVWDGRNDAGKFVKDGRYDVVVTAKDRSGNQSDPAGTAIKVLTAMRAPTASPILFHAADNDALAQSTTLAVTLNKQASMSWRIQNAAGDVVRRGMVDQVLPAGVASWAWDGLNDEGLPVKDGVYTSIVTASTAAGTYSHRTVVRVMPFNLKAKLKVTVGQTQTMTILTAEPVNGWPRIEVTQPGLSTYRLYPTRYTTQKFTARWTVKSGATGPVTITITTTDTGGGVQVKTYKATLR
jgi:flagellar hook assembly protein FlgD